MNGVMQFKASRQNESVGRPHGTAASIARDALGLSPPSGKGGTDWGDDEEKAGRAPPDLSNTLALNLFLYNASGYQS